MRALRMRRVVAGHQKLTTTNWVLSLKLILLQLHEKLPKNSMLTILQSFGIWNKLERWKNSISRFCMSWPQIKNVVVLKSHLLFCATTTNHFLIGLWHAAKSWFYPAPHNVQLSGWTKKKLQSTSQSQTWAKTGVTVTVGWSDPLQLSESRQNHYIWEVCSANQWDALKTTALAASIVQQKGPNSSPWQYPNVRCTTTCCVNNASKVEWMGLWNFASSAIFTWPLTNWLPLLQASQQLFAGKMLPQLTVRRKCFPIVCQIPKQGFLCYKNKQTYFLLAKMCWL